MSAAGFTCEPGRGHWKFFHPMLNYPIVVDPRRPFVLPVYVRNCVAAIDAVDAKREELEREKGG
jgi:hypothetical protein